MKHWAFSGGRPGATHRDRPQIGVLFRSAVRLFFGAVLLSLVSGCATSNPLPVIPPIASTGEAAQGPTNVPNTTSAPNTASVPNTTAAEPPRSAKPSPTRDHETIIAFRKPAVILYTDPQSNSGEKTIASTLHVPMIAQISADNPSRLAIATIDGPRWIAKSDVVSATSDPSTQKR